MPDAADLCEPAADRQPAPSITRFVSADARQSLVQLQASPAIGEGKVCLVGLDAVRTRMAARWIGRREMVDEHLRATLRRRLRPHDFFVRISETEYLVAQPDVSRLAGQTLCLNVLREVLTYFLGAAEAGDIAVHEVSAIVEGQVGARALDPFVLDAQARALAPEPAPRVAPGAPGIASQDRWSPFTSHDGRRLRVSCQLEPVIQLKTYGRIGYRMTRRVLQLPDETPLAPAEVLQLTRADIERLDFATLARGLNRLQVSAEVERQPSLILPVSYATLSSHRGRTTLAEFFLAAKGAVQQGLICEVCDIDGVPPGGLLAAAALMRPFCLFVVGRLGAAPQAPLTRLKDTGLSGLCVDCPPGLDDDDSFGSFVETVMRAARPAGVRAVMLSNVGGPRMAAIAGLHGATHASFAPARMRPVWAEPAGLTDAVA